MMRHIKPVIALALCVLGTFVGRANAVCTPVANTQVSSGTLISNLYAGDWATCCNTCVNTATCTVAQYCPANANDCSLYRGTIALSANNACTTGTPAYKKSNYSKIFKKLPHSMQGLCLATCGAIAETIGSDIVTSLIELKYASTNKGATDGTCTSPLQATGDVVTYQIVVNNQSPNDIKTYIFMEKPEYAGGTEIYVNSLGSQTAYANEGNQVTYTLKKIYAVGMQQQYEPPAVGVVQSTSISATTATPKTDVTADNTRASVLYQLEELNPICESVGEAASDQVTGSIRITAPEYDETAETLLAGLASVVSEGTTDKIVLSSFIQADAGDIIDLQPITKFYITKGDYQVGVQAAYSITSQNQAVCDATGGQTSFTVTIDSSGENWSCN